MKCKRGDVVLVQFPFSSGASGKKRPAEQSLVMRVLGSLPETSMSQVDRCLKASLGITV